MFNSNYNVSFFQNLKQLAEQDLSKAHLEQHFTGGHRYLEDFGHQPHGKTTWSSIKPQDTLVYNNGVVTGKKFWVSGVELCEQIVVPAKNGDELSMILIDKKNINTEPVATLGMEGTLTIHFTCDNAPATYLGARDDPRCRATDHFHRLAFFTIQLGISKAAFIDIDTYTSTEFKYIKDKVKLDIEILELLWNHELDLIGRRTWERSNLIYAFAKKVLTQVAQLTTEITGSGLYEINHPSHQRFKDLLIYTTHKRNTSTAIKDIKHWSF